MLPICVMQAALHLIQKSSAEDIAVFAKAVADRSYELKICKYSDGKIYKIIHFEGDEEIIAYIGSTIRKLPIRWSGHKSFFRQCPDAGWTKYVASRGGADKFQIALLEAFPCKTNKELLDREAHHINKINPVCNIALRKASPEEIEKRFLRRKGNSRPADLQASTLVLHPFVDKEALDQLERRLAMNPTETTEADKWTIYKFKYMVSWGLSRVDLDFISENGTGISYFAVKAVIKLLMPSFGLEPFEEVSLARYEAVCAGLEVMRVMGWKHLFDHQSKFRLGEDNKHQLLDLPFFSDYEDYIRKINPRAVIHKSWDNFTIFSALETVFHAVGLKLVSKRKKTQVKKVQTTTYLYSLDPTSCSHMAALINLRTRCENEFVPSIPGLEKYLIDIGYGPYAKYVL